VVEFRAKGKVELWDPWTGDTRPLRVEKETETGTQVVLPLNSYEAQIVVFSPGEPHKNPPEMDRRPVREKVLPDEWEVIFLPTMDNRFGDFRLPVTTSNKTIGIEARRFAWARETEEVARNAMNPNYEDTHWATKLHGHGPQFFLLGPIPAGIDVTELEATLAALRRVDPTESIKIGPCSLDWQTYDFSWHRGKEGNLGHQGYHGLKRTVTDDFLCLGKTAGALNETRYINATPGDRYYLWTSATAESPTTAKILVGSVASPEHSHTSPVITPAAVYVNGAIVSDLESPISLKAGANPTLIRYNRAGRGHFVMRRSDQPLPTGREDLAMRWAGDPGLIRFDVQAGERAAEWFRFLSAPGTSAIHVDANGQVKAWIGGKPMLDQGNGRFEAGIAETNAAVVALRVEPMVGYSGGAVIPQPVLVETTAGTMPLGDWSQLGILNNYSGGIRYSTMVELTEDEVAGDIQLDLGEVVATAEVYVNGTKAGVRVAPPWRFDVSGLLSPGTNKLEVIVYNTLSNHYQTIPSRYRGSPRSGLIGPVRLLSPDWKSDHRASPAQQPVE